MRGSEIFLTTMFRFQHSEFFWLLLLLPLLAAAFGFYLRWRKAKTRALGTPRLIKTLIRGHIPGRRISKFVLSMTALFLGILGLANLQMGNEAEKVQRKGVDIVFALDVSKSMLAEDVSPNRLARAKLLVQSVLDKMNDNRVGLVLFAGSAYQQSPLTIDYGSFKMLLSNASPEMVPSQGTVLGDAISTAQKIFTTKEKKYKTIVLISDGEDHDEEALRRTEKAKDEGIIIHTVGIGSAAGAPIIDPATGQNKVDETGATIISKLNEQELKDIAKAAGGSYHLLKNHNETANALLADISQMESKNLGAVVFADYSSYFQYFLLAAVLFMLMDWLLPSAKKSSGHASNPSKITV